MTKIEITQQIASVHNCLAQIQVCGDGAIMMGDALKGLRLLVQDLQKDIEDEAEQEEGHPATEEA